MKIERIIRRIKPGIYEAENGQLQLDVPELLADWGLADTPSNRELVCNEAIRLFREILPDAQCSITRKKDEDGVKP